MAAIIVLATHGVPPRDFPPAEMAEFFSLHARIETGGHGMQHAQRERYRALDDRMRAWPRTTANDPFRAASLELAARLSRETGLETIVGFNEFCGPSLDEAFAAAAARGTRKVIVVTPMLTRGGEHAGSDIPEAIARARVAHPGVEFVYAWPFDDAVVVRLLADQVRAFSG